MKILLLNPKDNLPEAPPGTWDLVVDCARAQSSTYEMWRRKTGASCISLFDFAQGFEDLQLLRELLGCGMGVVVDPEGIDWWDVLSLSIEAEVRQLLLVERLARQLPYKCEMHVLTKSFAAAALARFINAPVRMRRSRTRQVLERLSRYQKAAGMLDRAQLAQVVKDKFDPQHRIRRRLTALPCRSEQPLVLLPSAYINVSRTAAAYARCMPDRNFLMVYARESARLASAPGNVAEASLNPYFKPRDRAAEEDLDSLWERLAVRLAKMSEPLQLAVSLGLLRRAQSSTAWGLAIRDAWKHVFHKQRISAVLCADDSNPYSRIPLILASKQRIPSLACHHGALDFRMAFKTVHSDFYLAKTEMERDYLVSKCGVDKRKVHSAGNPEAHMSQDRPLKGFPRYLVFFTEPYAAAGWREGEVYRELIPRLWSLAQSCGLELALKIHPFEAAGTYRKIVRQYVPEPETVQVLSGFMTRELWSGVHFAVTVQSSVALECVDLGIPVFLCGWLVDPYSDYVNQFAKFSAGHELRSIEDLKKIPELLAEKRNASPAAAILDGGRLSRLFAKREYSEPVLSVTA